MNKLKIFLIIIIIFICIIGLFFLIKTQNNKKYNNNLSNIDISKTSYIPNNTPIILTEYTTQIKDKSPGRINNINITCNTLNNTIIKPNEIFSFNEIVGKPTTTKGYMEAPVIINNKLQNGIGGGNCQVSSTIYNAVLQLSFLEVLERYEHGLDVSYVPEGKDAAVSYGQLDFRFKNNSNDKLKLTLECTDSSVTAKIIKIFE